jgi:hypothetical protein
MQREKRDEGSRGARTDGGREERLPFRRIGQEAEIPERRWPTSATGSSVGPPSGRAVEPPQGRERDPGERGDGRSQRHGVVRVDDPLREAEHRRVREEPAGEKDHSRGAGPAPELLAKRGNDESPEREKRKQPRDLACEGLADEPCDPRAAPEAAASEPIGAWARTARGSGAGPDGGPRGGRRTGARGARRALAVSEPAEDAPEAVVPEGEIEDGVRLRAVDPGPPPGIGRGDDDGPRERDDDHDGSGRDAADEEAPDRSRGPDHVGGGARREDRPRGQHLHVEADADERRREEEVTDPSGLARAKDGPGDEEEDEDEPAVEDVVPIHRDAHGRDRECESGEEARGVAEMAAHEDEEKHDGRRARERLRHENGEGTEADQPGERRLDPERDRRLVHGEKTAGIERGEQKVVPAREHAADGGRVIRVAPAVPPEPVEAQDRGEDDLEDERREDRPARRGLAIVSGRSRFAPHCEHPSRR